MLGQVSQYPSTGRGQCFDVELVSTSDQVKCRVSGTEGQFPRVALCQVVA